MEIFAFLVINVNVGLKSTTRRRYVSFTHLSSEWSDMKRKSDTNFRFAVLVINVTVGERKSNQERRKCDDLLE